MLFNPKHQAPLDRLADELRGETAPSCELFYRIAPSACRRVPLLSKGGKAAQLDRLIASRAWTDAAFALIALELPAWQVRRLAYEDGEWICSLSREPNLPAEIDDGVDVHHEVMALAILGAFLQARSRIGPETMRLPATVPQVKPAAGLAFCCDNFA
jgi:hypothetical protein